METSQELEILNILLPLLGILLIIAIGVVLLYQQFQKNIIRQRLEKEELKGKYQRELLETTINVQEEERKRIAQDLHDELGAALSIGRMQLIHLEKEEQVDTKKLIKIRELIETTLTNTRRISHQLMPLQLAQLGLENALSALLEKAVKTSHLSGEIAVDLNDLDLPWLLEVAIYRIYSELINNTLKHANADFIEVSMFKESNKLFCRYADNGKGLSEEQLNKGLGLKSIAIRVEAFEGKLNSGNHEDGGFFANIIIPLS